MDAKKFAEDQQKIIDNFVTGAAGLAQLLQSSAEKFLFRYLAVILLLIQVLCPPLTA